MCGRSTDGPWRFVGSGSSRRSKWFGASWCRSGVLALVKFDFEVGKLQLEAVL